MSTLTPLTTIFIGPQGSGKGTQASLLGKHLLKSSPEQPVINLETGKHFRALMTSGTYTGERIKALLDEGQMIPNFFAKHIVLQDLADRLTEDAHLTMDGFPRNEVQVRFVDDLFSFYKRPKLSVVFLDVPEAIVRERLLARGRFDDTGELIEERLKSYREGTLPVVELYQGRQDVQFVHIDGAKTIDAISVEIISALC